jgi:hypothetical protein
MTLTGVNAINLRKISTFLLQTFAERFAENLQDKLL